MANINQVITLGIGTPSGVDFFVLLGLQSSTVVNPACMSIGSIAADANITTLIAADAAMTLTQAPTPR